MQMDTNQQMDLWCFKVLKLLLRQFRQFTATCSPCEILF